MAGSVQFINGMAPGLASMFRSLVDSSAAEKGYKYGIELRKADAETRKIEDDLAQKQRDDLMRRAGMVHHLSGMYGVPSQYVETLMTGGDTGAFKIPQDVSNNVLRDLGALMYGKPTDISTFHGGMAELPMKQAKSSAAKDLLTLAQRMGDNGVTDQMRVLSAVQSGGQLHQAPQTSAENRLLDMYLNPATRDQAIRYRMAGATTNNFPGGFIEKLGADGKPHKFMVSHDGKLYDLGLAVDTRDPLKVAISEGMSGRTSGQMNSPSVSMPVQPSAMPQAKSQYVAPNGRIVSIAEIEATARKHNKTPQQVINDLGLK